MDRCPNCAARWDGQAACRRCGMELAGLSEVEQAAESRVAQAIAQLAAANPEAASRSLTQALALRRTPLAEHLLGFVQRIARDRTASSPSMTHQAFPQTRSNGNGRRW